MENFRFPSHFEMVHQNWEKFQTLYAAFDFLMKKVESILEDVKKLKQNWKDKGTQQKSQI